MRPKGSRSPRSLLVIAIIVIVVIVDVDRAQVMREHPLGHVAALLAGLHVGKAEVNAFPDAGVDHVMGRIREALIRDCRHLRVGECVICSHREGHFVGPEEEGEHTGYGAGDVVRPGGVVGIVRNVDQGQPIRVTDRLWVTVIVGFVNGRVWPPKMVVEFGVPGGDDRIAHRQVDQGEQARTVIDAEVICGRDVPQSPFPQHEIIGVPEQSEVGLPSVRSLLVLAPIRLTSSNADA